MAAEQSASRIRPAKPRQVVQVEFGSGGLYEGPRGTTLEAFVRAAMPQDVLSIVAALVDGELRELAWPVQRDVEVSPLSLVTGEGMRIYRRSLCFLLIVGARELFPRARIIIDHSLTPKGRSST